MQSMGFSQATNIFPIKLWQLVNDREIDAIKWNDQGDGIIINKNLIRENFLCLNGFKASNSMSFVRQLNAYGFKKSRRSNRDDHNIHYYFHHNFQQNQPELLSFVKRCYQRSRVNAKNDQKKDLTNRWRDHRNLYDPLDDPRSVNLHNSESCIHPCNFWFIIENSIELTIQHATYLRYIFSKRIIYTFSDPLLPQAIAMNIFSVNHDHSYQVGEFECHWLIFSVLMPDSMICQRSTIV